VCFYEEDEVLDEAGIRPDDGLAAQLAMLQGLGVGEDDGSESDDEYLEPLPERFPPYYSLHVICNHENVWANLQSLNPSKCSYEIDNPLLWKPFCSFDDGFTPDDKFKAQFYEDPQIPGRLKQDKANKLAATILAILKQGVQFRREKDMLDTLMFNFDPEAEEHWGGEGPGPNTELVLAKGLKLMEEQMIVEEDAERSRVQRRLQGWRAEIQRCIPPNHDFEGIPINFSFSDAKRIKNRICDRFEEWVTEEDESEEPFMFYFGACCAPYYCAVNSTWIYACKVRPLPPGDDDE